MQLPASEKKSQTPERSRRRKLGRIALHCSLFLAFSAGTGALLVWPQWMLADGARQAAELQIAHEHELQDRLDTLRAMGDRMREWQDNTRRVFVSNELDHFPALAKSVAVHQGAALVSAQVTMRPVARWKSVSVQSDAWTEAEGGSGGEIQPRAVHLVLTGNFDSIYKTVGTLCGQQQMFIPDRWDISPAPAAPSDKKSVAMAPAGQLKAEVWATVFLVREPEDAPKSRAAGGPLAAGFKMEGEG